MPVFNRPVTSREYKLLLNVERFHDRATGAAQFLGLLELLVARAGGQITARQDKVEQRRTSYLDTVGLNLQREGFVLRLREELPASALWQINLKYRSPDRYLAAVCDLSGPGDSKIKFEEDILPPFVSKFSHSNTIKVGAEPTLETLEQAIALFPGLKGIALPTATKIATVNDFIAEETVLKVRKFTFTDALELKASLSFWYHDPAQKGWPLVVEFSFDYDTPNPVEESQLEHYPPSVVNGATSLYAALQRQEGWLSVNSTTKTSIALNIL